jgi:hypothetical protein
MPRYRYLTVRKLLEEAHRSFESLWGEIDVWASNMEFHDGLSSTWKFRHLHNMALDLDDVRTALKYVEEKLEVLAGKDKGLAAALSSQHSQLVSSDKRKTRKVQRNEAVDALRLCLPPLRRAARQSETIRRELAPTLDHLPRAMRKANRIVFPGMYSW